MNNEWVMTICPLVRVIVIDGLIAMISPGPEDDMAWRNDPGPLSSVLVTGIVAALAGWANRRVRNRALPNAVLSVNSADPDTMDRRCET